MRGDQRTGYEVGKDATRVAPLFVRSLDRFCAAAALAPVREIRSSELRRSQWSSTSGASEETTPTRRGAPHRREEDASTGAGGGWIAPGESPGRAPQMVERPCSLRRKSSAANEGGPFMRDQCNETTELNVILFSDMLDETLMHYWQRNHQIFQEMSERSSASLTEN
jgi:hypothetical protein